MVLGAGFTSAASSSASLAGAPSDSPAGGGGACSVRLGGLGGGGRLPAAGRAARVADRPADVLVVLDRLLQHPRLLLDVANPLADLLRRLRELVGPQE